jgi:hypothetical protein
MWLGVAEKLSLDFTGLDWWTHGRLVNYEQPNPAEPLISNWLVQNPQRLSLANVGFIFGDINITENQLENKGQDLDLWSGGIASTFTYRGSRVDTQTWSDPEHSVVAIQVESDLLEKGDISFSFDFPYSDLLKFDAPYVGVWNDTAHHKTVVETERHQATFKHMFDSVTNYLSIAWDVSGKITGPLAGSTTKYVLQPSHSKTVHIVAAFSGSDNSDLTLPSFEEVRSRSKQWWQKYWSTGAFIDLSATGNADATELQRRIILSQYLMAVNGASDSPPQGTP